MSTLFAPPPFISSAPPPRLPIAVRDDLPLTEKYRPKRLEDIAGQLHAVSALRAFSAKPKSCAYILSGATGTGKTCAAMALAAALGCAVEWDEFGGFRQIPAGRQTADAVRALGDALHLLPFCGSGWRVCVVNEADQMSPAAETAWLDQLENLPQRCVIIFTTNNPDKLSQRFIDRCRSLTFEHTPDLSAQSAVRQIVGRIYAGENRGQCPPEALDRIFARALVKGAVSYRRVVQAVADELQ